MAVARAFEVERLRVGELVVIAVRGGPPEHRTLARSDRVPVDFGVLGHESPDRHERTVETEELLDCLRDQLRSVAQQRCDLRLACEPDEHLTERAGSRLEAAEDQKL